MCEHHFPILSKMEVKSNTWCECASGLSIHRPRNPKVLGQWIQPVRYPSKHRGSDVSQVSMSWEGGRDDGFCWTLSSWLPLKIWAQASGHAQYHRKSLHPSRHPWEEVREETSQHYSSQEITGSSAGACTRSPGSACLCCSQLMLRTTTVPGGTSSSHQQVGEQE